MIDNLTDTARLYALARAEARSQAGQSNAGGCAICHETAHNLSIDCVGLDARQITALARAFAADLKLANADEAIRRAELIPQDAAQ